MDRLRRRGGVEASQVSYATPEEAYAAAMDLPLTIVNRDGDEVHEVVYEHALKVRNEDSTPEPQIVRLIDRLRQ